MTKTDLRLLPGAGIALEVLTVLTTYDELHSKLHSSFEPDQWDPESKTFVPKPHFVSWVDCPSTFVPNIGDTQEITPENIDLFRMTILDLRAKFDVALVRYRTDTLDVRPERYLHAIPALFTARVRKMRPLGVIYNLLPRDLWPMFDAVGPERTLSLDNPVRPSQ